MLTSNQICRTNKVGLNPNFKAKRKLKQWIIDSNYMKMQVAYEVYLLFLFLLLIIFISICLWYIGNYTHFGKLVYLYNRILIISDFPSPLNLFFLPLFSRSPSPSPKNLPPQTLFLTISPLFWSLNYLYWDFSYKRKFICLYVCVYACPRTYSWSTGEYLEGPLESPLKRLLE